VARPLPRSKPNQIYIPPTILPLTYFTQLPMQLEPIVSSETSATKSQTPGNYPKRNKLQYYVTWKRNNLKCPHAIESQLIFINVKFVFVTCLFLKMCIGGVCCPEEWYVWHFRIQCILWDMMQRHWAVSHILFEGEVIVFSRINKSEGNYSLSCVSYIVDDV